MKLEDIAKLAGVSKGAASLALNNKSGVSEETRKKVLEIAREANYTPLRQKKKHQISEQEFEPKIIYFVACQSEEIVTQSYQNQPFFDELLTAIATEARKKGNISLALRTIDHLNIRDNILNLYKENKMDGIILLATSLETNEIKSIEELHIPLVLLDTCVPECNINFVTINNFQGGYLAGKQICKRQYNSIGYAQSETRIYNFEERKEGLFKALSENELSISEENIFTFSPTKIEIDETMMREQFIKPNQPQVIFCDNDYIAISLIKTLNALSIKVPEDIAVIGFDNIRESSVLTPELSTINVSKHLMAQTALNQILEVIEDPNNKQQFYIGTNFIERQSF
ncbi:TPA: LacI family DNA-binding transcriptional regulator [Streptococcus suis]